MVSPQSEIRNWSTRIQSQAIELYSLGCNYGTTLPLLKRPPDNVTTDVENKGQDVCVPGNHLDLSRMNLYLTRCKEAMRAGSPSKERMQGASAICRIQDSPGQ